MTKTDKEYSVKTKKDLEKVQKVEHHLRMKCHRYKKHIKNLERGVRWRNEVIAELGERLGVFDKNEIVFSKKDFELLIDLVSKIPPPNKELKCLFATGEMVDDTMEGVIGLTGFKED